MSLEDRVESELCDGAATDRLTIHYSDGREDFKLPVWNSYLYRPLFRALRFEDGVLESALAFDSPQLEFIFFPMLIGQKRRLAPPFSAPALAGAEA